MLRINEEEATLSTVVNAGDQIRFVPARHGAPATKTVRELLGEGFVGRVLVNNAEADFDAPLQQGDVVLTLRGAAPVSAPAQAAPAPVQVPPAPVQAPAPVRPSVPVQAPAPVQTPAPVQAPAPVQPSAPPAAPESRPATLLRPRTVTVFLNGEPLSLPRKESGSPYYLMDLLQYSGIDFDKLDRPVRLEVNGVEQGFQYELRAQDQVTICLM